MGAWWLRGKESACNAGDAGTILRSHGGENDNPLQYSGLENPMDRGAWRAPWSCTESDTTEQLTLLLGTWEQDLIGHIREGAQKTEKKGSFWEMGTGGKIQVENQEAGLSSDKREQGSANHDFGQIRPKACFCMAHCSKHFFEYSWGKKIKRNNKVKFMSASVNSFHGTQSCLLVHILWLCPCYYNRAQ